VPADSRQPIKEMNSAKGEADRRGNCTMAHEAGKAAATQLAPDKSKRITNGSRPLLCVSKGKKKKRSTAPHRIDPPPLNPTPQPHVSLSLCPRPAYPVASRSRSYVAPSHCLHGQSSARVALRFILRRVFHSSPTPRTPPTKLFCFASLCIRACTVSQRNSSLNGRFKILS
jgi:hypothetical protein